MKITTLLFLTIFVLPMSGGGSAAFAEGDPAAGRKIYETCKGCHSLADNRTGPRHCGLLGRKAGTEKGFNFSAEMKNSGLVWDVATLERFIESPLAVVPGTTMGFAGVKDKTKRMNLIAYLVQASQSKQVCSGKKSKKSDK